MKKRMAAGKGNQDVQTPDALASYIVNHFKPSGKICEPCKGHGAFVKALKGKDVTWYEIKEGRDFFEAKGYWDWIITNPPWGKTFPRFLNKFMQSSDNIIILNWASSWWTKRRLKLLKDNRWGIVEIFVVPTPRLWNPSGFAVAATWLKRGWDGGLKITLPTRNPKFEE